MTNPKWFDIEDCPVSIRVSLGGRPFRLDFFDSEKVREARNNERNLDNGDKIAPPVSPSGSDFVSNRYWTRQIKNTLLESPELELSEEEAEEITGRFCMVADSPLASMLDETPQEKDGESGEIPEDIERRALNLLENPGFLDRVRRTLTRGFISDGSYRFVEGESKKKLFTYLCFLSARTPFPQFEWISGDPGSGKTNMASTVSHLFPRDYVQKVGYITGAGIRYLEDRDYDVLYIQEFRGQEEQDVRLTSIEDKGFKVIIAGRDQETGEMSAEEHFVPAKAFVTTSADELPTDQLVRRTWLVSADESDSLTRRVNERVAEEAEGRAEPADEEWIEVLRAVPNCIEQKEVKVPYASEILEVTDWDRTNYKQFIRVIKIVAHAYQRQREERDGEIAADIRDLYMAFRISDAVLPETVFKLPDRLREALDAVKKIEQTKVTKNDVASELGKAGSTAYAYLEDLERMGFVHKGKKDRENVYTPTEKSQEELSFRWIENLDWNKCEKKVEEALGSDFSALCEVSNPKRGFIMDDPVLKGRLLMSPSPDGRLRVEKIVSGGRDGSDLELSGEELFLSQSKNLNKALTGFRKPAPDEVLEFPEEQGPSEDTKICEPCKEEMELENPALDKFDMNGREIYLCEKCAREAGFID